MLFEMHVVELLPLLPYPPPSQERVVLTILLSLEQLASNQ